MKNKFVEKASKDFEIDIDEMAKTLEKLSEMGYF